MRVFGKPIVFDNGQTPMATVYSDRLFQWHHQKHDDLCQKHFGDKGQYWYNREPKQIESFLRDYVEDQSLVLCRIEESENQSTGYPVWRFDYLINVL